MASNETTKYYSNKQETAIAHDLDWDVVSGSGARPVTPGDIISDDWLGECKTHTSPNHSILFDTAVWKKITDEAMMKHRKPALFVDDGSQKLSKTWVVCYLHSIDASQLMLFPYEEFKAVRKNITFNGDKAADYFKKRRSDMSEDISELCPLNGFITDWNNSKAKVVILDYYTFKEVSES